MTRLTLFGLLVVLVVVPTAAQDRPVPPAEAARRMTLPAGFRATLFAGLGGASWSPCTATAGAIASCRCCSAGPTGPSPNTSPRTSGRRCPSTRW